MLGTFADDVQVRIFHYRHNALQRQQQQLLQQQVAVAVNLQTA